MLHAATHMSGLTTESSLHAVKVKCFILFYIFFLPAVTIYNLIYGNKSVINISGTHTDKHLNGCRASNYAY